MREVKAVGRSEKQSWLWGEILLAGLLGASLALFVTHSSLRTRFDLPELRLVLQTTMTLAGLLVAVLAAARYAVEGRRVAVSDLRLMEQQQIELGPFGERSAELAAAAALRCWSVSTGKAPA